MYIKRKLLAGDTSSSTISQQPLRSNSYFYNTSTNGTSSTSASSKWPSSSTKSSLKSQYSFDNSNNGTTSYNGVSWSGLCGLLTVDENLLLSTLTSNDTPSISSTSTTATTTGASCACRRPHKYNASSKYLYPDSTKSGGSKTEKIISKSSKSSPNLHLKDYEYSKLFYSLFQKFFDITFFDRKCCLHIKFLSFSN